MLDVPLESSIAKNSKDKVSADVIPIGVRLASRPHALPLQQTRNFVNKRREDSIQEFLKNGPIGLTWSMKLLHTGNTAQIQSRYQYTPNIVSQSNGVDEAPHKIDIRSYTLGLEQLDILKIVIPNCSNISSLTLQNCGLTNDHATILISIVNQGSISNLALDQNILINESIFGDFLGEGIRLRSLSLRSNKIGDVGAKSIAHTLTTNKILLHLDLFDNKISSIGAKELGLALKVNSAIQVLSLAQNNIGDEGVFHLTQALMNPRLGAEEVRSRKKQIYEADRLKQQDNDSCSLVSDEESFARKKSKSKVQSSAPIDSKDKMAVEKDERRRKSSVLSIGKKLIDPTPLRGAKIPEDPKAKKIVPVEDKKGKKQGVKEPKTKKEELSKEISINGDIGLVIESESFFQVDDDQWFVTGNRSLNSLNLMSNGISDVGIGSLLDLIREQDRTFDQAVEGSIGLFRHNKFSDDCSEYYQLREVLASRNPFNPLAEDINVKY